MSDDLTRPLLRRAVTDGEAGRRLDRLLAAWLTESRAAAQRRIDAGTVRVDDQSAVKSQRPDVGQLVEVTDLPAPPPAPVHVVVSVRYEDAHLAVVCKPAGLVVHAGAGVRDATLVDALAQQGMTLAPTADPDRPGVVHRLDRGTSGLLVVAKTPRCLAALQDLLAARRVRRVYLALCDGTPGRSTATIDAPIGRDPRHRTRFAVDPDGRSAVTRYDVVEAHARAALLRLELETGRTHQIRVHLAAIGHPVVADTAYGAAPALARELGLNRPALHATRLAFTHPVTGGEIDVAEPLSDDLGVALARLRA